VLETLNELPKLTVLFLIFDNLAHHSPSFCSMVEFHKSHEDAKVRLLLFLYLLSQIYKLGPESLLMNDRYFWILNFEQL